MNVDFRKRKLLLHVPSPEAVMGRPRIRESSRRSLRISVRLSPLDLDNIHERKAPAESVAGYLRSKALRRKQPQPVPEVNRLALRLLNEYAQRINHQARDAHLGAPITLTVDELRQLAALLRRILQALRTY